jgi:hypothetical protein
MEMAHQDLNGFKLSRLRILPKRRVHLCNQSENGYPMMARTGAENVRDSTESPVFFSERA